MAYGGKRAGAGRKRGVPNKASAAREARVAKTGATPLDVMLHVMRFHFDRATSPKGKPSQKTVRSELVAALAAAKDAAPYVHPKFSSITHSGHLSFDPSRLSDRELDQLEELLTKSAPGGLARPDQDREGSTQH